MLQCCERFGWQIRDIKVSLCKEKNRPQTMKLEEVHLHAIPGCFKEVLEETFFFLALSM